MYRQWKNNAASILAAPLAELDTALTVPGTHGDRFPTAAAPNYFLLTLRDAEGHMEIVKVTSRSAGQDVMVIDRGQEGTSPRNWLIGAIVSARVTAGALSSLATQADPETLTNKTMGAGCGWAGDAVPVANGGTGATTASSARANLGAQAADPALDSLSVIAAATNHVVVTTGADTYGALAYGATGAELLGDATAADARATLGLGPLATEAITLTPFTQQLNVVADAAAGRALLAAAADASVQTAWIPAGAMIPQLTDGASTGVAEVTANLVMLRTLDFPPAVERFAQFAVRMPKGWNEGNLRASFVWSSLNAPAPNNQVVWEITAMSLGDGTHPSLSTSWGSPVTSIDDGGGENHIYQSPQTAEINPGGTEYEQGLVVFRVSRDGTNGSDSLSANARLHGVTLYYTTTSLNDA